jgi:hypothetical protein
LLGASTVLQQNGGDTLQDLSRGSLAGARHHQREWVFIDPVETPSIQQEPGFGNVVQLGVNLLAVKISIQSDGISRQPVKADLHFLSFTSFQPTLTSPECDRLLAVKLTVLG